MIPLVLLPGMMCDARIFAPQTAALSGRHSLILAPITAHESVQALAGEILAISPDKFALAGLSMGGIVAMEIMRQAPERVVALALLDTNHLAELELVKTGRIKQLEQVASGSLDRVMREEMKPNYLTDGPKRDAILDLCMDMALDLGPDVFARQSHALMSRPDQSETLRKVRVPTLVLCGKEDTLCPPERHELMHKLISGSTLEVIENAGHLPTLEQPEQTTAALIRWMETI